MKRKTKLEILLGNLDKASADLKKQLKNHRKDSMKVSQNMSIKSKLHTAKPKNKERK